MAFDVSRAAAKAAQGLDSSFAPASYPVPFAPLELLSPARDFETARAAILHGADAVYMGDLPSAHAAPRATPLRTSPVWPTWRTTTARACT